MPFSVELKQELERLAKDAAKAPPSDYKHGYMEALKEVYLILEDLMWDRGEDDE